MKNNKRITKNNNTKNKNDNTLIDECAPITIKTKPRRAAAIAATSSFKETIKAQEALLKSEKKLTAKRKNTKQSSSQRIRSLGDYSKKNTKSKKHGMESATFVKSRKKTFTSSLKNEDDVSFQLLSSTNGGGQRVNRIIRKAMNNAVHQAYERSRALSRISAVQSGSYTITSSTKQSGSRSLSSLGLYNISYKKGNTEGRGNFIDESIEILPVETLKSVILTVYNDTDEETKEMLRANNMAQLSPRVFWSLVYHNQHLNDISTIVKSFMPDLDLQFLNYRKRELSEKAKENLRQERVERGDILSDADDEEAIKVITEVEQAMSKTMEETVQMKREQRAQAALDRFTTSTSAKSTNLNEDSWSIQTPTEYDSDELLDCISSSPSCSGETEKIKIANFLQKTCLVHNWRQLANAELQDLWIHFQKFEPKVVTKDEILSWINYAQSESIDEIMLEIVESNEEAFLSLREEGNCGTPKDLSFFVDCHTFLWRECQTLQKLVDENNLKCWCIRAKNLLEKYTWLYDYVTPIS